MKAIETERLFLREWQKNDVRDLFDIMKNPLVINGGWKPHSSINTSVEILNEYIESNERWAVELKDTGKVIGSIRVVIFLLKLSTMFYPKIIGGNGYMTEAVKRIIEYLFEELDIDLISAFHYPDNDKSKKVLERCGFQYEITIEQGSTRYDGQVFDSVCYSILKSDYFQNKSL